MVGLWLSCPKHFIKQLPHKQGDCGQEALKMGILQNEQRQTGKLRKDDSFLLHIFPHFHVKFREGLKTEALKHLLSQGYTSICTISRDREGSAEKAFENVFDKMSV